MSARWKKGFVMVAIFFSTALLLLMLTDTTTTIVQLRSDTLRPVEGVLTQSLLARDKISQLFPLTGAIINTDGVHQENTHTVKVRAVTRMSTLLFIILMCWPELIIRLNIKLSQVQDQSVHHEEPLLLLYALVIAQVYTYIFILLSCYSTFCAPIFLPRHTLTKYCTSTYIVTLLVFPNKIVGEWMP